MLPGAWFTKFGLNEPCLETLRVKSRAVHCVNKAVSQPSMSKPQAPPQAVRSLTNAVDKGERAQALVEQAADDPVVGER
jgi:hypothetical protein